MLLLRRDPRVAGIMREDSGMALHSRRVGEDPFPGSERHNISRNSEKSLEAKRLSEIPGDL